MENKLYKFSLFSIFFLITLSKMLEENNKNINMNMNKPEVLPVRQNIIPETSTLTNDDGSRALICMGILALLNCIILYKSLSKNINPNNPSFAYYEMLKQSAILFLTALIYGAIRLTKLIPILGVYEYVIYPVLTASLIWILNVNMGYQQLSECKKKNKMLIFLLSLFFFFFIIIVYFACNSLDFMMAPFENLFGGKRTAWSYWSTIGFWMACSIWPTVSYSYFTLQRYACSSDSEINIQIPEKQDSKNETT